MPADDDYFSAGLSAVRRFGTERMQQRHFAEEKEPPDYTRRLPLGEDLHTGDPVWIQLKSSDRIGVFGRTGSGKTTLLKALSSRLFDGGSGPGIKVVHLTDVKNDFAEIDRGDGVSDELIRKSAGLLPEEEKRPLPVKMYLPKFMEKEYGGSPPTRTMPDKFEAFTYGVQDLSESEFISLTNSDASDRQKEVASALFSQVDIQSSTLQSLKDELEKISTDKRFSKPLQSSLDILEDRDILSTRYRKDPARELDDHVLALAMEHWDRYKGVSLDRLEVYVSITIRRIMDKIRNRELQPPVLFIVDEGHAFLPADDTASLSRRDIVDLIDLGRDYDLPMLISTQRPSQIPTDDVVKQMSHFLIPWNIDPDTREFLLREANLYQKSHPFDNSWSQYFNSLTEHDWLYISRDGEWRAFSPYAPLCRHSGSD